MEISELHNIIANIGRMLLYSPSEPMLFSSGLFWALFLLFLPIYSFLKQRKLQMMVFTALFSLYFYYKSSGLFFLLLICTSAIDWQVAKLIHATDSKLKKKLMLLISICFSLSVLGYFKYANFFLWNWSHIVSSNFQPLDIILPVGISFYTFQSISYVVDVYNGKIKPRSRWLDYLFYLSFFPALVAGPIVRADKFFPQLDDNRKANYEAVYSGLWMIIVGIIKKAVIADYIAQYNDLIFNTPTGYSGLESLMAVVGYTMQIYCDFSGYSDMAIGLALILGFDLGVNFRLPYQSRNITEFWHRWHISLSTWLRDYVYIPLGGNRKGTLRKYINNLVTMLVGGLWHGAAWKFVFWGGMHGVGLVAHKACAPLLVRIPDNFFTNACGRLLTILFVSSLWVFFRADSFGDAWTIIQRICTDFDINQLRAFIEARSVWCAMIGAIIFFHCIPESLYSRIRYSFVVSPWIVKLLVFIVAVQLVVEFMSADVAPFIYFQF